jgi:predicted RNase H-like nuclease (RuvC/YqgF family)
MNAPASLSLFCGLDIHRSGSSYAVVVDESGNIVQEKKLSNDSIVEFVGSHHPTRVAM